MLTTPKPDKSLPNNIEAKRYGIKTGMTVRDARLLYRKRRLIPPSL